MDGNPGPSVDQVNAPYAMRWELLKGIITRLYMDEKEVQGDYKDHGETTNFTRREANTNVSWAFGSYENSSSCKEKQDLQNYSNLGTVGKIFDIEARQKG